VMHSVSSRMLLAVGVVVTVAVVAVGFVVNRATRSGLEEFLDVQARAVMSTEPTDMARHRSAIVTILERSQGPGDLQDSLRAWAGDGGPHLLFVDPAGETAASHPEDLAGADVQMEQDGSLQLVRRRSTGSESAKQVVVTRGTRLEVEGKEGMPLGALFVIPATGDEPGHQRMWVARGRFLHSVDRWMVGAVAVAGLLALVATAGIARRLLGPVHDLTAAARRLAGGDLDARVSVRSRDEIGELAAAFNAMAASLARGEKQRRQMVTDVAHELRTPLTNLRGQLEAMEDGLLQPTPEVLESLREETRHLARLVEDLQELSLAEAGRLRLDPLPFPVEPEIRKVVAGLRPGGPAVEVAAAGLPEVFADPERFRQILRNLVENAITHTPPDGVIHVRGGVDGGLVRVEVEDTGSGIAPEHLERLFERFYRGDASRTRATGGAGLGLAIVKELVEAQGGTVWVRSDPGRGACFGFSLPRHGTPSPEL